MKKLSNSVLIGSKVMHAVFQHLVEHGRTAHVNDIKAFVRPMLKNNTWANEVFESNGLTRWETFLHFYSIDAVKAGFLSKSKGMWTLTESGVEASKLDPVELVSRASAAYRSWRKTQLGAPLPGVSALPGAEIELDAPPEEQMYAIQRTADESLSAELIERILANSPQFFEKLVLHLLLKMGYGGYRADAAEHTGQTGDGGIDGIIHEDALGLDPIYLQAKRYKGSVPDNEVRDFIGALAIRGGKKGVFITTGRFAENAKSNARNSQQQRVVLIDGAKLAELMIKHDVGVAVHRQYTLKRIDGDWFEEE